MKIKYKIAEVWGKIELFQMNDRLLKILEKEVQYEKSKKKKKTFLKKEKRLMYYSGWHKDDKPVDEEEKSEKQTKL